MVFCPPYCIGAGGAQGVWSCPPPCDHHPPPPPSPTHQSPLHFIILIVALGISFIVILICYFIFVKARSRNDSSGEDLEMRPSSANSSPVVAHTLPPSITIININSTGLDQSFINSISTCNYKKGDGLVESTECSVCLYEFQADENLRILPNCVHAFHLSCIDTWLKLHNDCPLCRARVDTSKPVVTLTPNTGPGVEGRSNNGSGLEYWSRF